MRRVLFVDRGGTLVAERKSLADAGEQPLVAGVIPALLRLKSAGYQFVIVTNQPGLGGPDNPRPLFERADQSRCLHDTRIEMLRAALAVRAFEQARGLLPPSLGALSPGFLEPAPIDSFSGATLRFDRTQRVIYSLGTNGLDEGGRARTGELVEDAEALEPRFPLFAPWAP